MKTRAAVAWAPRESLTIVELDLRPPASGEVLVEIVAAGICRLDLDALSGADPGVRFPAVLGHEGAGVVRGSGKGARLRPGEHVIPLFMPSSMPCAERPRSTYCIEDRDTGAKSIPIEPGKFKSDARTVFTNPGCSTFSRYVVFPEAELAKVRQDAPLDRVCIACTVATGLEAVLGQAKVGRGAKVVVLGLDPIGLNVLQASRMAGAEMIIGVDLNTARRSLGQKFGMSHFINPNTAGSDRLAEALLDLTEGGADFIFECGPVAGLSQMVELDLYRKDSRVVRQQGIGTSIHWPAAGSFHKVRPFSGTGDRAMISRIVDWYMEGIINVDDIITSTLPFDRINDGFNMAGERDSLSTVLKY
jgi:S-(hydroxymethyl)glutathione dehydrogenase / alcohol dehydrogenase